MSVPSCMYLRRYACDFMYISKTAQAPLSSFRNWQLMIIVLCVNCPQALTELMKVLSDKAVTQNGQISFLRLKIFIKEKLDLWAGYHNKKSECEEIKQSFSYPPVWAEQPQCLYAPCTAPRVILYKGQMRWREPERPETNSSSMGFMDTITKRMTWAWYLREFTKF